MKIQKPDNLSLRLLACSRYVKKHYDLDAVPSRIRQTRWESDDTVYEKKPIEGSAHQLLLEEGFGLVVYSWDDLPEELHADVKEFWDYLKKAEEEE